MSSNKKFVFVTNKDNWNMLLNEPDQKWPVSQRYINMAKNLVKGDEILIYLTKKSVFAGMIEVTEELKSSNPIIFNGDIYHAFIKIKSKIVLTDDKMFPIKNILKELDYTKEKIKWGTSFQRAIVKFTENDFNLVRLKLEESLKK